MPVEPEVKKYFDAIEALESGDVVAVAVEYSPGTDAEQWCMHENTLYHLFVRESMAQVTKYWWKLL